MSIDQVFDLSDENTQNDSTAGPDTSIETANTGGEGGNTSSKYPNVIRTVHGEVPEDVMTPTDFAKHLTFRNIQNGEGLEGFVNPSDVANALTAKRVPLPVVVVVSEDGKERAYLPANEATEVWDNRPKRGEGGTVAGSKRSDEDLLRLASEARKERDKRVELKAKQEAALVKAEEKYARYDKFLADRELSWEQVDEFDASAEAAEESAPSDSDLVNA